MYLRYIASYHNTASGKTETGIFRSADFVRDHTGIDDDTKARLQTLITWFDENLPVPEFYDDPAVRKEEDHTYFWFKSSAKIIIQKMDELCAILKTNGIEIERLKTGQVSGKLVFEDECQIAVRVTENVSQIK